MAKGTKYRTVEYLESRRGDESSKRGALAERCGAVVYGIGSLFEPDRVFTSRSDIDLVAKGIPSEQFFTITAGAAALTSFDVDIIPLDDANELIKKRVSEHGVRL